MRTAVVGAGPSGLLAALAQAADRNDVVLIDEQSTVGGHLRYDRYAPDDPGVANDSWLTDLTQTIEASEIKVRLATVVWAAYRNATGFDLMLSTADGPNTVQVDRVVLATGTTDVELNVPGSTLPGVLTERAVRILIEMYGVIPGQRFALIGDDDSRTSRLETLLGGFGSTIVRISPGEALRIGGTDGVTSIETARSGQIPVDAVVLAIGERPDLQLAGMLDVPRIHDASRNAWFADERTLLEGITLVGGALLGACSPSDLIASTEAVRSSR